MFKMFDNVYKVLVVQFPVFLYSSILGSIQFVSGLTHRCDTLLEERQRGEKVLRTTWIPPRERERVLGTETGDQRRAEQQAQRAKGGRLGRRKNRVGGEGTGKRREPERTEGRLGQLVLIVTLAKFSDLPFGKLIQVFRSSSPGEQCICFCQVP